MRAVVVPAAPALIPGVGGTADPLADLRGQARALVASSLPKGDGSVVVVGAGETTRGWPTDAPSGEARFTTGRVPEGALPTAPGIGRMVLPDVGDRLVLQSIAAQATPQECADLGRSLTVGPDGLLVVVADGPATLTEKAPGHLQPDATPFARELARALADGDVGALAGLDPLECDRLWMRGRPALQVLAGAAAGASPSAQVLLDEAPFGVQYLLARWDEG